MQCQPNVYFAGQITGVEGYIESAASGILAGLNLGRNLVGKPAVQLPNTTMLGALIHYVSAADTQDFQPMGCNMGLLPPLPERIRDKAVRYETIARRGLEDLDRAIIQQELLAPFVSNEF